MALNFQTSSSGFQTGPHSLEKLNKSRSSRIGSLTTEPTPPPVETPPPRATAEATAGKDTEAPVSDGQVPEVDAQVVCRHVRLAVAVDGDGVDVVGVAIGEDPPWAHLHHQIHGLQHGHLRRRGR